MFTITMLYSVVQPLIVIFGAVYFGVGYVVYKYKLLFGMWCLLFLYQLSNFCVFSLSFRSLVQFSTNRMNLKVKPGH